MVDEAHALILSIEKEEASIRDASITNWVNKAIALDKENRELKERIELLSKIRAAQAAMISRFDPKINSLKPESDET